MRCPNCGNPLDEDNYCSDCMEFFNEDDVDYEMMANNGDEICLNCTYWSVSPYGSAYGMVCRRGNFTEGPGDSCTEFVQEIYMASYGSEGEFQFNETGRAISNKLYHWRNNR